MTLLLVFLFSTPYAWAQSPSDPHVAHCAWEDFSEYFGRDSDVLGRDILHVDLRDIVRYRGDILPEIRELLERITDRDEGYLPRAVNYSPLGPRRGATNNQVYGIEITGCPILRRESVEFYLQMFYVRHDVLHRKSFFVNFDRRSSDIIYILPHRDHPWLNARLQIVLSLMERKAIVLEGTRGQPIKTYPVAVGGLDEGLGLVSPFPHLLTPLRRDFYINIAVSNPARRYPSIYGGRPFLRLSLPHLDWTTIAFHIKQNPQLIRGFESHGCVRMREKDLYELYWLLKHARDGIIPLAVVHQSALPWDHPYPLEEDSYGRVSYPRRRGEKDGLIVMERVEAPFPYEDYSPLK